MKLKLLILFLIQTQILTAQTFTEVSPSLAMDEVQSGDIAFSDVNGDGHDDVLITGQHGKRIAKLYTNDGMGNFTEIKGTPFEGVSDGSIAFSDVNGDGYNDVLIAGLTDSGVRIAKLYTNNGTGTFTEMTGTPFDGVYGGEIAFSDVNGDGHDDVLISGDKYLGDLSTKLYTNDGTGTFTEMMDTPFDLVSSGSIAFSDVNGDGYDDVLITGRNSLGEKIAKLFTNDGTGNFNEMTGTPFDGVFIGSIAFSDVNSDGHDDVLITGKNNSSQNIAKLYTNDGTGTFTEITGTPFEGVSSSSIAFSDVNGDGYNDVLITGQNSNSTTFGIAKLYTNDGTGTFTEKTDIPFDGVRYSAVAFSDVNGDGHDDVFITGVKNAIGNAFSLEPIGKLYTNDGTGTFTQLSPPIFNRVRDGSIAFSDVNGDGNKDVLITGWDGYRHIAKLYTNDGTGAFTELTGTPFTPVEYSSIAFSDVNGDGYDDVLITGQTSSIGIIAKLYTNDGTGNFTEMTGTPFDGVKSGSIAFSDVNGDGSNDVLITGINQNGDIITKLYTNDGTGTFTELTGTPFDPVWYGSIAFSDVNGDGHNDVLITGSNITGLGEKIAKLYINDGTGKFTEKLGTPLVGVFNSSIAFSDVNGDGYNDVLITGQTNAGGRTAKLYTNNGTGTFTVKTGTPFDAVDYSSVAFSDVNGDGHNDVLITGQTSSVNRIAKLYINDGTGTFTELTGTPFDGVRFSAIAFSDVNNDGYNDVFITGQNNSGKTIAKLYANDGVGSSIEDLNIGTSLDFILFPNPSTPSTLLLSWASTELSEVTIKVYNLNGSLLLQQKEYAVNGQQTFSIDITTLPHGSYFLELDDSKKKGVAKFIVH